MGDHILEALDRHVDYWDPRLGTNNERLTPTTIEDLKEVNIGPLAHRVTKIGTSVTEKEECELLDQLIINVDLFSWAPPDMTRIDTRVVCHCLAITLLPCQ